MDREKEIADMKISLENSLNQTMPGYEIHMFASKKQQERREKLERRLPATDPNLDIKKSNAWIVWISDENGVITDLQVYDFQLEAGPFRRDQIVDYVDCAMEKTPYSDCGCVNSDWDEWKLIDIYFKLGWQYGFYNNKVMIKCLKRLSRIDEFREGIRGHLRYVDSDY